ncbi:MAG: type II toxin-antitoxin system HicA family toxin [Verrucomicrobiales bacterium]|jgi:predicted RNA binding protein YcfA (HicA-like mRNA interferase family)|nr:type II toxin-antitoxin system HicA family toxin [Verrucomicrobiales bacterium]
MAKIPRSITGKQLIKSLRILGYQITRQKGSHIRITTQLNGEHHEVIPHHHPIKIGTLAGILKHITTHHDLSVEELIDKLEL